MTNLEKYADELIKNIKKRDNYTEDEIVRYIYFSLGKKIVFDLNWVYGNDYTRGSIYYQNETPKIADNYASEEKWPMICKSIAYILSYVGKKAGINIETIQDKPSTFNPYPHVYNKVIKKDNSEYNIDLYADLPNIYMNKRTEFFGFTEYTSPRVFSRKKLEEMDYKLGYITDTKNYTDEYYYSLKDYISRLDSIHEKIRVILENPSPYIDFDLEYDERRRYIINSINYLLSNENDKEWKWEWLDCYYFEDCHMYPKEIIYIQEDDNKYFFEYNSENKNFNKISTEELSTLLSNGLRIPDRCSSKEYLWLSEIRDGKSK